MSVNITLPIDAVPQGRPRFVNGIAIDPPDSRQFKRDLQFLTKMRVREILTTPLRVTIKIYRKLNRADSRKFGDIDNLVKGIMDAMTGIAWRDDCQVVELHAYKYLAAEPRIVICIEEVTNG